MGLTFGNGILDKEILREIKSIEALNNNEGNPIFAEKVESHANLPLGSNDKAKILGVNWDSGMDRIYFDIQQVINFASPITQHFTKQLLTFTYVLL